MTVGEVIKRLQSFDDDMEVKFTYPSGDYWHSIVCGDITDIDIVGVQYSEYHRKDKLLDVDEVEVGLDENREIQQIVAIM